MSAVASRIESQRILLNAVESLDTPYRVTIYLRYFEALPVRVVAARMGVPLKTVETRQARAVAMLRDTLGPRLRDPETGRWSPALVAFCDPSALIGTGTLSFGSQSAASIGHSPVTPTAGPLGNLGAAQSLALLVGFTMKKFAVATLALIFLITGWIAVDQLRTSPGVGVRVDGAPTLGDGGEPAGGEVIPVSVDGAPERSALAGSATPEVADAPADSLAPVHGALRVTVRWSNGELAEGVGVVAGTPQRHPAGVRLRIREVTGVDGVALFAETPPGEYYVWSDRGSGQQEGGDPVEIFAGETTEATVTIADGLDVMGRVIDVAGAPVAGAGIWLTSRTGKWTSGGIVVHTDSGGRFELRDLPEGPQQIPSIGALASGHLPSSLLDLDLVDRRVTPVAVELVVRRGGGTLEGVVTGEDGRPLEGVVVVFGNADAEQNWRHDDSIEEKWSPRYATTDAQGRYRMDALVTGKKPLRARRMGLAQWSADVTIGTDDTTQQDIVLGSGVEVHGTVTDESGAPIAGARVHAFDLQISETFLLTGQVDYDGAFAQEVAVTAQDGTYRLSPLPRRRMYLYAMGPRPARQTRGMLMQYTKTELDLGLEEDPTWDPELSDGGVITGSVRYRDGTPIKGIFVNVVSADPRTPDRRAIHSENGDFKFIQLAGDSYNVTAQIWELPKGKEAPRVDGAIPGGDPIELVADFDSPAANTKGTARVRFLDTGQRADGISGVSVVVESLERYSWRFGEQEGDVWRFDLDSPGHYRPIALLGERIIAAGEPFEFTAGANLDLSTLVSEPGGTLLLQLERSKEHPPEEAKLYLRHDDYRHGEDLELGSGSVLRFENMEAGKGTVTIMGKNLMRLEIPFEVRGGEETVVAARIVPAVGVPYHIELPAFTSATTITMRFTSLADGSIAHERTLDDARKYGNPIAWTIQLRVGDYRLEVELGDGRRGDTTFSVRTLDVSEVPLPKLTVK